MDNPSGALFFDLGPIDPRCLDFTVLFPYCKCGIHKNQWVVIFYSTRRQKKHNMLCFFCQFVLTVAIFPAGWIGGDLNVRWHSIESLITRLFVGLVCNLVLRERPLLLEPAVVAAHRLLRLTFTTH